VWLTNGVVTKRIAEPHAVYYPTFAYDLLGRRTMRSMPDSSVERWLYDLPIGSSFLHRQLHADFAGKCTITDFDVAGRTSQKMPLSSCSLLGGATGVAATANFNPAGANNALKFTAATIGTGPNGTAIMFVADNANITTDSATVSYDSTGQVLAIRYNSTLTTGLTVSNAVNAAVSSVLTAALDTSASPGDGAGNNGTGLIGAGPSSDSTWVTFTYAPGGQRQTMTDNKGTANERLTKYAYDESGRLRVKQCPEGTVSYNYDPAGAITEVSARHAYTFPANQPWVFLAANQTTVATFDYDHYDTTDNLDWSGRTLAASGMRRGMAELVNYSGTANRRVVAYDYDPLNRLRAERTRSGSGGTWPGWAPVTVPTIPLSGDSLYDFTAGYDSTGYDKVGNRRSRTSNGVNIVTSSGTAPLNNQAFTASDFDANDRLKNVASSYDANGNAKYQNGYVSQTTPSEIVPSSANPDQYDLENRLIQRTDGSTTVTIVYDGDGNRVTKTAGATTTYFLVDDRNPTGYAQVIEEQPSAGANPTVAYTYGLTPIAQDRGSGAFSYFGLDGQGSVRYLTSTAAAVSDTYTYDAFGMLQAANGSTINNYRYVGEQWDPELGMYDLRGRYYHPDVDRFWTIDTFEGHLTDPLSLHKYLYCQGNPINRIDPTGQFDLSLGGLLANVSIGSYLLSTAASYVAGKAIDIGFKLAIYQDWNMARSQFEWWNNWDLLNFIPGASFAQAMAKSSRYLHTLGVTLTEMRAVTAARKAVPILAETGARDCDRVASTVATLLEEASSTGARAEVRNALGARHTYCYFKGLVYDLAAEQYAKYIPQELMDKFAVAIGTGVFDPQVYAEFLQVVAKGLKL
jgi:RHS repeat-associated protein